VGILVIAGDINLHVDVADDQLANRFKTIVSSVNLTQHVNIPTHKGGHTLDLIMTRDNETRPVITNIESHEFPGSDHYAVVCNISVNKPPPLKKTIKYRKYKSVNVEEFSQDIKNSDLYRNPEDDIGDLVSQYNNVLTEILDKHAPVIEKQITVRPHMPWYTEKLKAQKCIRRQLERSWRKSKLTVDRHARIQRAVFSGKRVNLCLKVKILFRPDCK
jgi:hypothetical protein